MSLDITLGGTYYAGDFDSGRAEIPGVDPNPTANSRGLVFVTNGDQNRLDVLTVGANGTPSFVRSVDLSTYGGGPNSVAVMNGIVAVAIEANTATDPGVVALFSVGAAGTLTHLRTITVGDLASGTDSSLPDMLTFSPNGRYLVVANEGQIDPDTGVNPEGSVSIIDFGAAVSSANVGTATLTNLDFRAFNGQEAALRGTGAADGGIRITDGLSAAVDFEPEYVAISPDGTRAFVSLQENNAFAEIDLATKTIIRVFGIGGTNYATGEATELDASDRDNATGNAGAVNIRNWPVFGLHQPDALHSFAVGGQTYYISANEGDAGEAPGTVGRVGSVGLDSAIFTDPALSTNAQLGRLNAFLADSNLDGDAQLEQIIVPGTRSVTIWDAAGNKVWDSGDFFEEFLAARDPRSFNLNNDSNTPEARSDDKGPEPEGLVVGVVDGKPYAFVGLERDGGVMVFDLSTPAAPKFVTYLENRNPNETPDADGADPDTLPEGGDNGPEGLAFISAEDSPTGRPVLVVSNEVSNTTTTYNIATTAQNNGGVFTLQILHASDQEGGLAALDRAPLMASMIDALEDDFANSITLFSGDAWIPSPFYNASNDPGIQPLLREVAATHYGINSALDLRASPGRADILIHNIMGVQANVFGNHEFDQGTTEIANILTPDIRGPGLTNDRWYGADFPYLSANLNFSGDAALSPFFTSQIRPAESFYTGPNWSATQPAGTPAKFAPATIITEGNEKIGVVGATTQILETISSTGGVDVIDPEQNNMAALAAILQPTIDALKAQGINKIVLLSHLQQIQLEIELAPLLNGVDIIIAGGSHTLITDANDRVNPAIGVTPSPTLTYPIVSAGADGAPVLIVNTSAEYSYLGRLVVDFDAQGRIVTQNLDSTINGSYAVDQQGVREAWDLAAGTDVFTSEAFANGTRGDLVRDLVEGTNPAANDGLREIINAQDGNTFGFTDVYLEGRRQEVRAEETNFGSLTADANLWFLKQQEAASTIPMVAIKNGGGIRDSIGTINTVGSVISEETTSANPSAGKEAGEVSQLDISNALRFNNSMTALTVTVQELIWLLEHGIRSAGPGATPGAFPQIAGVSFSWDPDKAGIPSTPAANAGLAAFDAWRASLATAYKLQTVALLDEDGTPGRVLFESGQIVGDPNAQIRVVTLNFLANPQAAGDLTGGDGYPFPYFGEDIVQYASSNRTGNATFANDGSEQDIFAEYLRTFHGTQANAFDDADTTPAGDTRIQNLNARNDAIAGLGAAITSNAATINGTDQGEVITGGQSANVINAAAGSDTVSAGLGDDLVTLGTGNDLFLATVVGRTDGDDTIDAGAGIDTYDASQLTSPKWAFNINLANGTANQGIIGNDVISNFENVIGTGGKDTITGDGQANLLSGRDGNDIISGGGGNDSLIGGLGNDSFVGGSGNDVLDGDSGNDTHLGGEGNDVMRGSAGLDIFDGGAGTDLVDYRDASSIRVFLDDSGTNAAAAAGDRISNVENIFGAVGDDFIVGDGMANRLSGNTGNDTLFGRDGTDQLEGGAGNDRLFGGAGNDILLGGAGNDVFVFADAPAAGGLDRTTDFNVANDQIEIDASAFGGGLVAGGAVQFVSGAAPSTAGFVGGVFVYNTTSGFLGFDADGGGAGAVVNFFRLQNLPTLTAADFTVVA